MEKFLTWFLGPKAENSDLFEELIEYVVKDYIHWRRNYFPEDPILIKKSDLRSNSDASDKLNQNVYELMAKLRRNFPFYSPRYIAHMLSDVTLPSMIGYIGGMLYNANNVTPEAAPVTTEWEIEACNHILEMIGFNKVPNPPNSNAKIDEWLNYEKSLKGEFGWSHITSGGTVANIEALWVAKTIKYFPLSIQEIAINHNISLNVKLSSFNQSKTELDIRDVDKYDLINIKPNESIFMLAKLLNAVRKLKGITTDEASEFVTRELNNCKYGVAQNCGKLYTEFPPVIYCSGAAHYCIMKAADILGIGRNNVKIIKTNESFQLDIEDLEKQIEVSLKRREAPIAVIAVCATTEEGAVDPIDKIIELRSKFEAKNISYWLHVDAAWGGFINSILQLDDQDYFHEIINKLLNYLNLEKSESLNSSITSIFDYFSKVIKSNLYPEKRKIDNVEEPYIEKDKIKRILKAIETFPEEIIRLCGEGKYQEALSEIEKFISQNKQYLFSNDSEIITAQNLKWSLSDIVASTGKFVNATIEISYKNYIKQKEISWGGKILLSSLLAIKHSDSVTIDPHKMGYMQYPCGVISFRNDRVRHFISQKAPYITSSNQNALIHNSPRHVKGVDFSKLKSDNLPYDDYKIGVDAFAPFILEGSKPGAAASSLWLATKTIPLNRSNHGTIIKSSLLATRELYEWIANWKTVLDSVGEDYAYELLPLTPSFPDTNVLTFVVKSKLYKTLEAMNELTVAVYNNYSIQAELGDKHTSYSQPFFLSKTSVSEPHYSYASLKDFFDRTEIRNHQSDYSSSSKSGLLGKIIVLRASIMNPYIFKYTEMTELNLIKEFMVDLHRCCQKEALKLIQYRSLKYTQI